MHPIRHVYAQSRVRRNASDSRRSSQETSTTKRSGYEQRDDLEELLAVITEVLR
jgi:hypothetical protein